ncbi:hypothetical protein L1887_32172 [Cichorium endivia]|nr:hypothetical protein L1887_32172 [Cichorium endivia]
MLEVRIRAASNFVSCGFYLKALAWLDTLRIPLNNSMETLSFNSYRVLTSLGPDIYTLHVKTCVVMQRYTLDHYFLTTFVPLNRFLGSNLPFSPKSASEQKP